MIDKIKNIFVIPELKNRVLFTLGILITVRLGAHIPIPGIELRYYLQLSKLSKHTIRFI